MADSTDANSNPLLLSLRTWPKEEAGADSFEKLIVPISEKYGHFRHATEDKLKQEIEDEKAGKVVEESGEEETNSEDDDEKTQLEKIMKKKAKLQELTWLGYRQSGELLNTVSALESKFLPRQAEVTLSDWLKESIGSGKLNFDTWELGKPDEQEQEEQRLVRKGRNHEHVSNVADTLLKAAKKLNKEVEKEAKYWDQVLSVSEKGWSVFKLPQEQGTLGVQLGAAEAGPLFKARGVVSLRTNDDGSIKLHRKITAVPKAVRMRISRKGAVSGTSRVSQLQSALQSDTSLESLVSRARDSLFDEELFHEMILESRLLGQYNVTVRGEVIHLNIGAIDEKDDSYEVLVDLVPLDDNIPGPSESTEDSKLADLLAVSLRLLLCNTYHQRLQQRSQIPPPLTERPPSNLTVPILRPLLSYLLHRKAVDHVRAFFNRTAEALRSADVLSGFEIKAGSVFENLSDAISEAKARDAHDSIIQAFISALLRPLQTNANFTVPSFYMPIKKNGETVSGTDDNVKDKKDWTISIKVLTICAAPTFGVEFDLNVPKRLQEALLPLDQSTAPSRETHFQFRDIPALQGYFERMVAVDIAHNVICVRLGKWDAVNREAEVRRSVQTTRGVRKALSWSLELNDGALTIYRQWAGKTKAKQYTWTGKDHRRRMLELLKGFTEGTDAKLTGNLSLLKFINLSLRLTR
jgi:mediator of RNA polymerase II transcription subunit 17